MSFRAPKRSEGEPGVLDPAVRCKRECGWWGCGFSAFGRAAIDAASGARRAAFERALNPRREHPDLVDRRTRRNVERLAVVVAEADVGRLFGRPDGAAMLALGRDDPNAAGAGDINIALGVDPHAVGDAALGRVLAQVDEQLAVREHAVGEHIEAVD